MSVSKEKIIVRFITLVFLLASCFWCMAQSSSEEDKFLNNLNFGSSLPSGLLTGKSIALYESNFTTDELQEAQKYFQQSGIDAVNYLDIDYVLAGADPSRTYVNYFNTRAIKFLIILQKKETEYQIIFTEYNGTISFVDKNHQSWKQSNASLSGLLQSIYRLTIATQKKENFLILDVPEVGTSLRYFREKPDPRFSPEVKYKVAIPKFENADDEKLLESLLKENYKQKYDLVDANATDAELNRSGYRLVLRFVHTRGDAAREILGYDAEKTSVLVTNYLDSAAVKTKGISKKETVYKFYFKNTEYGNVFLGSKWDADITWQEALRNHILLMRKELKI